MMSRMQYRYVKGISQFHHAVYGNIIQGKIHSIRPLMKRRLKLERDICSQLDEYLNLFYKVEDEVI